jgi:hypothetical protein
MSAPGRGMIACFLVAVLDRWCCWSRCCGRGRARLPAQLTARTGAILRSQAATAGAAEGLRSSWRAISCRDSAVSTSTHGASRTGPQAPGGVVAGRWPSPGVQPVLDRLLQGWCRAIRVATLSVCPPPYSRFRSRRDELVGGVDQTVDGALGEEGVGHHPQPLPLASPLCSPLLLRTRSP